jgi:protein TonB
VSARLAQFKHYPLMAQRHGEEGVALVRFRVDHHGGVHGVALVQSSGHADLDQEAQDLVERAEPLPQPPADRTEDRIDLQLPIRFSLR